MIIHVYDDDLLNGEGIREVVFLQGCPHHCKGCFSPETWEFKKDTEESKNITLNYIIRLSEKLSKSYISGLTITGGDPLAPQNLKETEQLIDLAKSYNKTVWLYSGYNWKYIKDNISFIDKIDVLCEGPFIEELKSPDKPWVGSENQKVIDVQKSLKEKTIVLYDN